MSEREAQSEDLKAMATELVRAKEDQVGVMRAFNEARHILGLIAAHPAAQKVLGKELAELVASNVALLPEKFQGIYIARRNLVEAAKAWRGSGTQEDLWELVAAIDALVKLEPKR